MTEKATSWFRESEAVRQCVLGIVVLAVVATFASRAVYMDEHIFLTIARNALENPLVPSDVDFTFFGVRANLESHTHPPVGSYYLAVVVALFPDFDETIYRMLFSIFPILAIVAFYRLARRFTVAPFAVTLLLAVSPAFFVMSPTLMMDIPMLALFLLGLELFMSHRDGRRWRLPGAAIAFVLSAGMGYTVLVPLGCLFVWLIATRLPTGQRWTGKRRIGKQWVGELATVASAPVALVAWQMAMAAYFGHIPVASTMAYFLEQVRSSPANAAVVLSFVGGVSLFPWSGALVTGGRPPHRVAGTAAALLTGAAAAAFFDWTSTTAALWYVTLSGAGAFMLGSAAVEAVRRRGEAGGWPVFMAAWIGAVLAFFILVGDMVNARYVLLIMPPLFLLVLAHSHARALAPVIALTLALSAMVGAADYRFVNRYRDWVRDTVEPLRDDGYKIWSAAESGLRFYLEESGAEVLPADSLEPVGGDIIVRDVFGYGLAEELGIRLVHVRTDVLADGFPVRSFNMDAGAGFHDSRFGRVPYTWSTAPHDRVSLWQLSPLVERLPQSSERLQIPPDEAEARPPVVWSPEGPVLIQERERLVFPYTAPEGAVLRYEVARGAGRARLDADMIELTREGAAPVVWRNLRAVPPEFP